MEQVSECNLTVAFAAYNLFSSICGPYQTVIGDINMDLAVR